MSEPWYSPHPLWSALPTPSPAVSPLKSTESGDPISGREVPQPCSVLALRNSRAGLCTFPSPWQAVPWESSHKTTSTATRPLVSPNLHFQPDPLGPHAQERWDKHWDVTPWKSPNSSDESQQTSSPRGSPVLPVPAQRWHEGRAQCASQESRNNDANPTARKTTSTSWRGR